MEQPQEVREGMNEYTFSHRNTADGDILVTLTWGAVSVSTVVIPDNPTAMAIVQQQLVNRMDYLRGIKNKKV